MSNIKQGMILAAGLGKRMLPLTENCPKPLVELHGKKIIEYSIEWLIKAGVERIIINTHYLSEQMNGFFNNCPYKNQVDIELVYEEILLETGGGVKNVLDKLGEQFWVLNGDSIIVDNKVDNARKMLDYWYSNKLHALLMLHPVASALGYNYDGDFALTEDNYLIRNCKIRDYAYTGTQILSKSFFDTAPQSPFSLSQLYFSYIEKNHSLIKGFINHGDWLHVGDIKSLSMAEDYFSNHRS